jgi:hypothetical protein
VISRRECARSWAVSQSSVRLPCGIAPEVLIAREARGRLLARPQGRPAGTTPFLGCKGHCAARFRCKASRNGFRLPASPSTNPAVRQDISSTICRPGYSRLVRPAHGLTGPLKRQMMQASTRAQRWPITSLTI